MHLFTSRGRSDTDTVTGRLTLDGRPADVAGGGRGRERNFTGNFIRDQMEVRRISLPRSPEVLTQHNKMETQSGQTRPHLAQLTAGPRC